MITEFRGKYRFLSNFWPCDIFWRGFQCKTTEHAYQLSKALLIKDQEMIASLPTAAQAKQMGKKVTPTPLWDQQKKAVMLAITRLKYENPELREMLLQTGGEKIIEGNTWGDVFWGVCDGKGENNLGKILMQVRDEIREEMQKKG